MGKKPKERVLGSRFSVVALSCCPVIVICEDILNDFKP